MILPNLFGRRRIQPITLDDVIAAKVPNPRVQRESEVLELRLLKERFQTRNTVADIQERLAAGALTLLRGEGE